MAYPNFLRYYCIVQKKLTIFCWLRKLLNAYLEWRRRNESSGANWKHIDCLRSVFDRFDQGGQLVSEAPL